MKLIRVRVQVRFVTVVPVPKGLRILAEWIRRSMSSRLEE